MRDAKRFLVRLVGSAALDQSSAVAVAGFNLGVRIEYAGDGEYVVGEYVYDEGLVDLSALYALQVGPPLVFFGEYVAVSVVSERPVLYLDAHFYACRMDNQQVVRAVSVRVGGFRAVFLEKILEKFAAAAVDVLPVFVCHFVIHI